MTRNDAPPDDLDLLAYADGHLDADPGRRAVVDAWVGASPVDADRLNALMVQTVALRARFDPVLAEPVPERLLQAATAIRPRYRYNLGQAAAMMVVLLTGAAALLWMLGTGLEGMQGPQGPQASALEADPPAGSGLIVPVSEPASSTIGPQGLTPPDMAPNSDPTVIIGPSDLIGPGGKLIEADLPAPAFVPKRAVTTAEI